MQVRTNRGNDRQLFCCYFTKNDVVRSMTYAWRRFLGEYSHAHTHAIFTISPKTNGDYSYPQEVDISFVCYHPTPEGQIINFLEMDGSWRISLDGEHGNITILPRCELVSKRCPKFSETHSSVGPFVFYIEEKNYFYSFLLSPNLN